MEFVRSAATSGAPSVAGKSSLFDLALWNGINHLVDHAVFDRRLRFHVIVAVAVADDALDRLAGVLGEDFVQALALADDAPRFDLDIDRLALRAAERLVDVDQRVGQRKAPTLFARREEHRAHA